MKKRTSFIAIAGFAAVACNLVIDADVHNPGDLGAGPRTDGGLALDDGGVGPTTEGGVASDAMPEAGGGLTKGCPAGTRFCADFDDGAPLADRWNLQFTNGTATYDGLTFAGTGSVKMSMNNAPFCSFARLDGDWNDTKATSYVETHFKVRPSSGAASKNGELSVFTFQIDKPASSDSCTAVIGLTPNLFSVLFQAGEEERRTAEATIPFDAWSEIALKFVAGSPTSLVVAVQPENGARVEATFPAPQCPGLGGAVRLGLGLHCEEGTAEVRYDDYWLDWR